MEAPRLSVPLVLETGERVGDGMGGSRIVWRAVGVVYARMKRRSGRLRGAQAGAETLLLWTITLRGFPEGDPRRPVAGQRLRMGARIFRIDAVAEADPAGRFLDIVAKEERA
ncbi:head-tail adaptor protein [Paracoccus aerodenitrificans]|uniref:head-tail adaptor protein n=1 Tax=Paracoccus aerodenitrificans TaxID=3017781 RepID=UPI0022EFF528|nr:head-tail adaptor protein [Paracoccus aerodenitrificans]WBU65339.1 head-tail adaptor protein [Paracoccus aerodenitrificans]